jgi:hypothetical protein
VLPALGEAIDSGSDACMCPQCMCPQDMSPHTVDFSGIFRYNLYLDTQFYVKKIYRHDLAEHREYSATRIVLTSYSIGVD